MNPATEHKALVSKLRRVPWAIGSALNFPKGYKLV
jgi:hypothetical protein